MDVPAPKPRRRWQVPFWVLMAVPVVCAPVFFLLRFPIRLSPDDRRQMEYHWVANPLKERFWPAHGAWVVAGDPLVKIASIGWIPGPYGGYRGMSRWVTPDGLICSEVHVGNDRWGDESPATVAGLAQLGTLLGKLPPSNAIPGVKQRMLVAFPVNGSWVVREYRADQIPTEVTELAKSVGIWRD